MAKLVQRLKQQLSKKGLSPNLAYPFLRKAGDLNSKNQLTKQGKTRQALGASGRAKARAAKYSNHSSKDFKYSKRTNRATLKHG